LRNGKNVRMSAKVNSDSTLDKDRAHHSHQSI